MQTPVALIIFNRPETTTRVLDEIRKARPEKLLIVADGPRPGEPTDAGRCLAARAAAENVDWECQVLTNYADVNLGCGQRPATGLDWVFQNVDRAIILEDDCLPHPTFFRFCDELLDRYRDDERVMTVSGNNFQYGASRTGNSYYFSRYPHTWGWATWRRAWQLYDYEMRFWRELRDTSWLLDILGDQESVDYWRPIFDNVSSDWDVWDYQWIFNCWVQNALAVLPRVNLVSNIGWGDHSTHTRSLDNPSANLPTQPMTFPLAHPPYMVRNREADKFTLENHFVGWTPNLLRRLRRRIVGHY